SVLTARVAVRRHSRRRSASVLVPSKRHPYGCTTAASERGKFPRERVAVIVRRRAAAVNQPDAAAPRRRLPTRYRPTQGAGTCWPEAAGRAARRPPGGKGVCCRVATVAGGGDLPRRHHRL